MNFIRKFKLAIILIISLGYCLFIFYFQNHFLFRTYINGINVSFMNVEKANEKISKEIKNYNLKIEERNEIFECINGNEIGLQYVPRNNKLNTIIDEQNNIFWIQSIFKKTNLIENNLLSMDENSLELKINSLKCVQDENIVMPQNPKIIYENGEYVIYSEIDGNKLNDEEFEKKIRKTILDGIKEINLNESNLYETPEYRMDSKEVKKAKDILNKYANTKIVYDFGLTTETLDKALISQWLDVDNNMDVVINKDEVLNYVKTLGTKYNTIDKERTFKTSVGNEIKIKGGNYGFKINRDKEIDEIINSIENGQQIIREPFYSQKAICRQDNNDIGETYVEVNITKQMLWFYKDGKLIISGDVVTGNINRGNGTHIGIFELNYKQKNATLNGHGYSSKVTYWMPFDGNIGLHDASWRNSFGGSIYKNNGTHGCVNLPIYLAKKIYEEIDEGTPIICYNE